MALVVVLKGALYPEEQGGGSGGYRAGQGQGRYAGFEFFFVVDLDALPAALISQASLTCRFFPCSQTWSRPR